MASWLEVVVTFAGTMLVLALVAQSLEDVVKFTFAIKGWTRLKALRGLVRESARTASLGPGDGDAIMQQVVERLHNLAQNGVRGGSLRLDVLEKNQLMELVKSVDATKVPALKAITVAEVAQKRLADVAGEIEKWFDLSLKPVEERYRRRMRLGALGSALIVVLAVNADAFGIIKRARNDPGFRAVVAQQSAALWSADSAVRALEGSGAADSVVARARAKRAALGSAVVASDTVKFLGYTDKWKFDATWLVGVLVTTLLVGLGAPFWHDILEAVFGLKRKVVAATGGGAKGP